MYIHISINKIKPIKIERIHHPLFFFFCVYIFNFSARLSCCNCCGAVLEEREKTRKRVQTMSGGGGGGSGEAVAEGGGANDGAVAAVAISGGSNSRDDERGSRMDEGERSFGGNRWPRQETLALLRIRSDMDVAFRDATVKGPLWEEVSRFGF